MPSTVKWKPNPHVWRKFEQAQNNLRRHLDFSVTEMIDDVKMWKWNGRRMPKKSSRRFCKWARQMKRWCDKLLP